MTRTVSATKDRVSTRGASQSSPHPTTEHSHTTPSSGMSLFVFLFVYRVPDMAAPAAALRRECALSQGSTTVT
eukprot:754596-Hanusia_phi.AAC.1